MPLTSSQHGRPFPCTTLSELLEAICTELLTGTIYIDNVIAALGETAADGEFSGNFDTFRTSLVTKGVIDGVTAFSDRQTHLHVNDMTYRLSR